MSTVIELDLPEYPQGFLAKYGYIFFCGGLLASILFYANSYFFGLLSFLLSFVIVFFLNRKNITKQVVYKDICNEKALLAEIREIPFFGSYVLKQTEVIWKDVEIASIMPLQIRPITFFLIIRGEKFSLRTHFNVDIEYTDSSAKMYWQKLEKKLIVKSKVYNFSLELTDLLSS